MPYDKIDPIILAEQLRQARLRREKEDAPLYEENYAGYSQQPEPLPIERQPYYGKTGLDPAPQPVQIPRTDPNTPIDPQLLSMQLETIKKNRALQPPDISNPNQNIINPTPAPKATALAPPPPSDREVFDTASKASIVPPAPKAPTPAPTPAPIAPKSKEQILLDQLNAAKQARSDDASLVQAFQGLDILSRGIAGAKPSDPNYFKKDAALQDDVNKYSKLLEKYQAGLSKNKPKVTKLINPKTKEPVYTIPGIRGYYNADGSAYKGKDPVQELTPYQQESLKVQKTENQLKQDEISSRQFNVASNNFRDNNKIIIAAKDAIEATSKIKAVLKKGNPFTTEPIKTLFAKASGEKGVLSDQDISRYAGSPAFAARIKRWVHHVSTGQINKKDAADMRSHAHLLEVFARRRLEVEFREKSNSLAALYNKNPNDVYAILSGNPIDYGTLDQPRKWEEYGVYSKGEIINAKNGLLQNVGSVGKPKWKRVSKEVIPAIEVN